MKNNIQISFGKESITIITETSIHRFANLLAIDSQTGKIIEAGHATSEISTFNRKRIEKKSNIVFRPIYEQNKINLENVHTAILFLLTEIYRNLKLIKKSSCSVVIPDYEHLLSEKQKFFEYSIQAVMGFRVLSINGNLTSLSSKKLTWARVSLEYGRWVGLGLFLYIAYTNIEFLTDRFGFYYLLLLFASIGIGGWTVEILWLVFMQFVLPKEFVRLIFQEGYGTGGWSTSKILAKLILGNPQEER